MNSIGIHPSKQWAYDLVARAERGEYRSSSLQPLKWASEVVERDRLINSSANCQSTPTPGYQPEKEH